MSDYIKQYAHSDGCGIHSRETSWTNFIETRWGQTELNETQYTITTKRSKTGNMVTPLALDIRPQ